MWNIPAHLSLAASAGRMAFEAHTVIALRTLGLMGILPASRGESARLVAEKVQAFQESAAAAAALTAKGSPPQAVLAGAMAPYARRTASNYKRLTRQRRK